MRSTTIQLITAGALLSQLLPAAAQVLSPGGSVMPPVQNEDRRHVPYVHVREADLMWAKRIWRIVDMREKMNQTYFYPLTPNNERINLITLIQTGLRDGKLTAYDPANGDDFQVRMTREEALMIGTSVDTVMIPEAFPPYNEVPTRIETAFDPFNVKRFKLKEDWFFDKQRSVMEVRILAICPVMEVYDKESGELRGYRDMYWIDFNEARAYFADFKIYNPYNFAQRISYDDAFRTRMFASLIYKEDNLHDRRIDEYQKGVDALYEAEHVKNGLAEFEHNLWEY